jgi:hypothetical protein
MNTINALATRPVVRPEFSTLKAAADSACGPGHYGVVGTTLQIAGGVSLKLRERSLDTAAGNKNATRVADRRFTVVLTALVLTLLTGATLRVHTDCRVVASRFHRADVFVSADARSILR